MDDRPLYDVDPNWSPERKEAFVLYRDFGPERSIRGVAQALQKSSTLIGRWSSEDRWLRRVAAWDSYCDKIAQAKELERRKQVAEQHAQALDTTLRVLQLPALELARRIERNEVDVSELTPKELLEYSTVIGRVMPRLVVASRLVHGMSTDNVETVQSDARRAIEGATPEELDSLLTQVDDGSNDVIGRGLPALPAAPVEAHVDDQD